MDGCLGRGRGLSKRDLGTTVREVHPEVSFCAWSGGVPMRMSKKTAAGREAHHLEIAY